MKNKKLKLQIFVRRRGTKPEAIRNISPDSGLLHYVCNDGDMLFFDDTEGCSPEQILNFPVAEAPMQDLGVVQ